MQTDDLNTFYTAAIILENQEMLRKLTIADYPDMKKSNREKVHRQVYKAAYPDQTKRVVTVEDLKRYLGSVK